MRTAARYFLLIVLTFAFAACNTLDFLLYKMSPDVPTHEGRVTLEGPTAPVRVVFDRFDVPHVTAENDRDLTFGIGYLHGRERLFQMTVSRAAASGRLAELFGNQTIDKETAVFPDLLSMDRWFRVVGLRRHGVDSVERLTADERALAEAYVAGVNAAAEREPVPIEFKLLDMKPEPWTVEDVMTVARLQGWALMTNMPQELIRFLLALELGDDTARETYPAFDPPGAYVIERSDKDYRALSQTVPAEPVETTVALADYRPAAEAILAAESASRGLVGMPIPAASNSWVVGPTRTKSGGAIVANDPHLPHSAPAVFYLMHQKTPDAEALGVTFPGVPFIVIGRNRDVAWTATTTFADMQDLYLEKPDPADPARYLVPGGSEPFMTIEEMMRVKRDDGGYDEVPLSIRLTRHGPVLSDIASHFLPKGAPPIAIRTTMDGAGGDTAAMTALMRAKNLGDWKAAYAKMEVPIQNWLAADSAGRIGYFPAGRIPKRVGWDGSTPVPGWTGEFEWGPWISMDEIPQLFDPPSGFIATANNKVLPREDYPWPFSNDPMPSYRATRIKSMIEAAGKLDAAAVAAMQVDTHLGQADALLPALLAALDGAPLDPVAAKALDALKAWDRTASVDAPGAAIFFTTYREAWNATLADDLSPGLYDLITRTVYDLSFFDRLWTDVPNARVFDDRATPEREDRDAILRRAFVEASRKLAARFGDDVAAWNWGALHTLTFHHPMGAVTSLSSLFNAGPYPMPGALEAVFAEGGAFYPNEKGEFEVLYGPAMRMVVDFGDPSAGGMIVDMGQSGRPGAPTYKNAVEPWSRGELWPLSMDEADYADGALGTLTLSPAP